MASSIVLDRDVDIPMSDGTLLRADVYRPDDPAAHPVLVQRTPYDKAFFPFTWVMLDPTKLAGAGYAVVICDVRGRFASEGEFYPYVHEASDGYDTIEWAVGQPWSDGNVGTYGVSYMGQSQWLAAATRPQSMRCIAAATSPHDAHHDLVYRGGALCLGVLAS